MFTGKHLVGGEWIGSQGTFSSSPAHGDAHDFAAGSPQTVGDACRAAEEAFWTYGYSSREDRAEFLNSIADEIDARGDAITEIGTRETGLPQARLGGPLGTCEKLWNSLCFLLVPTLAEGYVYPEKIRLTGILQNLGKMKRRVLTMQQTTSKSVYTSGARIPRAA